MNTRHPLFSYVLGISMGIIFGSFVTAHVLTKRFDEYRRKLDERMEQIKRLIDANEQKYAELRKQLHGEPSGQLQCSCYILPNGTPGVSAIPMGQPQ